MDNLSISSGHISEATVERERVKLTHGKREEDRLTLLRLRRLSRIVMSKNERHRFEARKLYRSNIVKFLDKCLMDSSVKVRYLAMQLLCSTIPRLANKTDSLLKPLLPKVFQFLQKSETKDMKLIALHFLRGFFRHAKSLANFTDSYVRLGIENSDPEIQISCCLGLNIIFDQDIGNSLFSQLVIPIANLLKRKMQRLQRIAYRTLNHIENVVGEDRFAALISNAHPKAIGLYRDLTDFEESDSSLSANIVNCSTFVAEYQIKKRQFSNKDFGIFDHIMLDQLQGTRNCKRAEAVCNIATAFREILWKEEDLHPHLMEFLKLINTFVLDPNRLIEISGFAILKRLINKMGFILSPHLRWIIGMLLRGLASPNVKVRSVAKKALYRLMRNIHPMTVIWELLHAREVPLRETVLTFIQDKLSSFHYYELDMVALCNYLGQSAEDKDGNLSKCSKDIIVLLLDMMSDCPVYGIRTEAIKILLRNHSLCRGTLMDIGVLGSNGEVDYQEGFESYSDDETSDLDSSSFPTGSTSTSISIALTHRSISTAGESEAICNATCSNASLAVSRQVIFKDMTDRKPMKYGLTNEGFRDPLRGGKNMELHFQGNIQTPMKRQGKFYLPKLNHFTESPATPSMKESVVSLGNESAPSRCFSRAFADNLTLSSSRRQTGYVTTSVCPDSSHMCRGSEKYDPISTLNFTPAKLSHEEGATADNHLSHNEAHFPKVFMSENIDVLQKWQPGHKPKKHCPPFHLQKTVDCQRVTHAHLSEDTQAGGDVDTFSETNLSNLNLQEKSKMDPRLISESYQQDGVEVEVLNKNFYNFNIMQVGERGDTGCIVELQDTESIKDEADECSLKSIEIEESILKDHEYITPQKARTFQEYGDVDDTNSEIVIGESQTGHCSRDNKFHSKPSSKVEYKMYENVQSCSEISVNELEDDELNMKPPLLQYALTVPICTAVKKILNNKDADIEDIDLYSNSTDILEESPPMEPFSESNELQKTKSLSNVTPNDFEKIKMPFLPKSRELPRTPVEMKQEISLELEAKSEKSSKYQATNKKKKASEKRKIFTIGSNNQCEDSEKSFKKSIDKTTALNGAEAKTCSAGKHNSPSKWRGCQWKRDLEYASKAASCPWAEKFEMLVRSMKPFPPNEAEIEMKKAIDDLYGNSWVQKEDAMKNVIRLAKHHPELVLENVAKIASALSNEIRNFRQSVAGKAILTTGHLYEAMGKNFENNNLRSLVGALLCKSGNRTLAAYFRLVIKSLFKIISSTAPHKSVMAFISQGCKHTNKASRETAAQFIAILTERLGPEGSLSTTLSTPMLKCAAMFVTDSSPLTRYCGKRMFKVLMRHPEFEKMKDHQLSVKMVDDIASTLAQIKEKGVREEILPINVID